MSSYRPYPLALKETTPYTLPEYTPFSMEQRTFAQQRRTMAGVVVPPVSRDEIDHIHDALKVLYENLKEVATRARIIQTEPVEVADSISNPLLAAMQILATEYAKTSTESGAIVLHRK